MRAPLLLAVVAALAGCARTEVTGFAQGDLGTTGEAAATGTSGSGSATTQGTTVTSTSTGAIGTTGTGNVTGSATGTTATGVTSTGTTGTSGGECAPCSRTGECAPGGFCVTSPFDPSGQGYCTAPCTASGACADPGSICVPIDGQGDVGCVPQSFSCGTTGTSGTTGTTGTTSTGGCDVQACFQQCGQQGLPCDPQSCTCGGGVSSTTGGCDIQLCIQGCGQLGLMCDPQSCTCGGGVSSTTGGCDVQACFQQCGQQGLPCDPQSCTCGGGVSSATGTTGGCDAQACFQRCAQVGMICDPNSCGCFSQATTASSSTGGVGTSSTGGSGTTSTGSAGTVSSSTTGTTGGGDCRNTGCASGETCNRFGTFGNRYWACACTRASANTSDSCAVNATNTVCDGTSYQCRAPQDYEPCAAGNSCASGYSCFSGYCLQGCASTPDCSATYTHCVHQGGLGLCLLDPCGPGSGQGGPNNGDYYAGCEIDSPGDGFCQPFDDGDGGVTGYCLAVGPTPVGASCPGFGVDKANTCVAGALCLDLSGEPARDGGSNARCFDACNASQNPGQYARGCQGNSACFPDQQQQSNPEPGICFP